MSEDFDRTVTSFFKQYQDRGMLKWAGFYLSDHTQQLEKEAHLATKIVSQQAQQSRQELTELLLAAFNQHLTVTLQLNTIRLNDDKVEEISGNVTGFTEAGVLINGHEFLIDDLRHIQTT
ncbi:hypothetical protein ACFQHW_11150 [Lapidilactobacillus achengensis]|uniref:DNA-directed RNA polymerase beta subunit n=1 Tax=Lapidilactobacillus achengensis TaxID=2486000 RepID=A0ABW1UR19_9LACO|nr:hypothetical protein [Lapidilactobacillus achengensis]